MIDFNIHITARTLFPDNKAIITQCGSKSVITNTRGEVIAYDLPLTFDRVSVLECKVIKKGSAFILEYENKGPVICCTLDDRIQPINTDDKFHYSLYFNTV